LTGPYDAPDRIQLAVCKAAGGRSEGIVEVKLIAVDISVRRHETDGIEARWLGRDLRAVTTH
jgi:hypothetical protein